MDLQSYRWNAVDGIMPDEKLKITASNSKPPDVTAALANY
jgi:hypothetical protein